MCAAQPTDKPRLLIADDNEAARYLFKLLISDDCDVIAEVEDAREAIEAVSRLCPDILLMDISMPGVSGMQAARFLSESMPDVKIILASQYSDRVFADEAFKLGIKGYVLKSEAGTELATAVREVSAGRLFRSSRLPH